MIKFGTTLHLANFFLNNLIVNQYLKSISILISGMDFYALPSRRFPKGHINFTARFLNKRFSIFIVNKHLIQLEMFYRNFVSF